MNIMGGFVMNTSSQNSYGRIYAAHSYKPKKKFGQHFLNDQFIFDKIIESADLKENDIVWEIGAGMGALTDNLLKQNIDLTIFEIDNDLIPLLEKKYENKTCNPSQGGGEACSFQSLKIIHKDILKIDWMDIVTQASSVCNTPPPTFMGGAICYKKIKIVTNLPYQISSPFLYKITEHHQSIECVVVMLQKEVAKRVCAKPGCKDYGVLSLKTQFYFETEYLFEVSPEKFTPPPEVHSAVIRLLPRKDTPQLKNIDFFWNIVESAFRMKRKTLRNNLKGFMPNNVSTISDCQNVTPHKSPIDLQRRGETLSEKEFISLYEYLLQFIDKCSGNF